MARNTRDKGKLLAAVLAVIVHAGLLIFLIFSINWRNQPAEPVVAELYAARAPEPVPAPLPVATPPAPEPPPVEPPPVKIDTPPPKTDIALKEKQERLKKEKDKKEKEQRDAEHKLALKKEEERRREAAALQQLEERQRKAQLDAEAAARARLEAEYARRIQAKIRSNLILPPDLTGNPEAVFDVAQLPTGEVIDIQLKKSSGHRAYDEAVQRAILKSSPLPKPEQAELFRRNLTLKFRPEG